MTKTRWIQSMTALWLAGTVGLQAEVKLEGRSVETPGHMIELDALGLPAQLQIRAAEADLPLRLRGGDAPTVAALQALGRGPQLSVPMRIEAVLAGEPAVATAMNAALPQVVDGAVVVQSDWQAGALHGTIALRYTNDGAISGRVRTRSGGAAVERLDLSLSWPGRSILPWPAGRLYLTQVLCCPSIMVCSPMARACSGATVHRRPAAAPRRPVRLSISSWAMVIAVSPGWYTVKGQCRVARPRRQR